MRRSANALSFRPSAATARTDLNRVVNGVCSITLPQRPASAAPAGRGNPRAAVPARTFIAGDENRLACVAVAALLDDETTPYNPLTLYGPSGSGKSHLAEGLALEFERRHPQMRVVYVTAADFAREYNDSFEEQTGRAFRKRFRAARLLALDDLGQLVGKATAQQALVHALDAVLSHGGKVIVTARHAPGAMAGLLPALRSRLAGGLTVPLALPGSAARQAILREYAEKRELPLSDAAAAALAEELHVSAEELHGALVSLAAVARDEIDAAAARRFLDARDGSPQIDLPRIAKTVAQQFGLKLADLKSPSRCRGVVLARGAAMHLARQLTDRSLQQIGAYFGGRDHTTVLHGCRRIEELLTNDATVRQAVQWAQRKLLAR